MRKSVVLGSFVGAMAIHLAFIACSSMPSSVDSGGPDVATRDASGLDAVAADVVSADVSTSEASLLDSIGEIARDVLAMEAGDARAGGMDGGTCACPPPPQNLFSFTFDRGHGTEHPRPDYSSMTLTTVQQLNSGVPLVAVNIHVSWLPSTASSDNQAMGLVCSFTMNPDGSLASSPAQPPHCAPNGGFGSVQASISRPEVFGAITATHFTDTSIEIRVPTITIPLLDNSTGMEAGSLTFSNVVFQATDPNARWVAPPTAFRATL